jgi:hypothetical protein
VRDVFQQPRVGRYHQLAASLRELWAGDLASKPLLVGPCEGMVGWNSRDHVAFYNFTTQWVRTLVKETAGSLDALVYVHCANPARALARRATETWCFPLTVRTDTWCFPLTVRADTWCFPLAVRTDTTAFTSIVATPHSTSRTSSYP